MRKNFLPVAFAVMTMAGVTSCYGDNDGDDVKKYAPGTLSLSAEQTAMSVNQNSFAWRMFDVVNTKSDGGNTVVSPLSMVYCLGMVNNGAAVETSKEITSALGFDAGVADINEYCKKLLEEMPKLDSKTTMAIANCVEVNKQYALQQDFEKAVKDNFNALVESRNFADSGFKDYLNRWVRKHTSGMIPELFSDVDAAAVSYIVNAIYFKGVWAEKFDKANTSTAAFTTSDGKITNVDMMHQTSSFKYTATDLCQVLNMDYGNGSYSMQLLLPRNGKTVEDVISAMKGQDWRSFIEGMGGCEVRAYVPKFTIEYGGEMNSMLENLGATTMFTPLADFSKFCDKDVYVSRVIQKAKIAVDEEGTTAAAATGAEMMETAVAPSEPVTFRADHPFIFVITEHSSGTICFIGQYGGK